MNTYRGLKLVAAAAAVILIAVPPAWADRDHDGHRDWRHEDHGRAHGLEHRDDRNGHYPRHRAQAHVPRGHWVIPHRGINYYFSAGVWYRPLGPRFVVVTPPIGAIVPVLPPYTITVWAAGVSYYYADGVYYVWNPYRRGYVVSVRPFGR